MLFFQRVLQVLSSFSNVLLGYLQSTKVNQFVVFISSTLLVIWKETGCGVENPLYLLTSHNNKITLHIVFQEGGRGQHRAAEWGSWPAARGFESAKFSSKGRHLIRLATAGWWQLFLEASCIVSNTFEICPKIVLRVFKTFDYSRTVVYDNPSLLFLRTVDSAICWRN